MFRLGKMNIVVCLVIGLFGVFWWLMLVMVVVLYCKGLLINRLGCCLCVRWVVL